MTIISGYFLKKFYDLVASSLSKVKESIIEALREENPLPHQKMEKWEGWISVLKTDLSKYDQYKRRNNRDKEGITDCVSDDQLDENFTEVFNQNNVKINKLILRSAIVWVSPRKRLLSVLLIERTAIQFWKKNLNRTMDNIKIGYMSDVRIFVSN